MNNKFGRGDFGMIVQSHGGEIQQLKHIQSQYGAALNNHAQNINQMGAALNDVILRLNTFESLTWWQRLFLTQGRMRKYTIRHLEEMKKMEAMKKSITERDHEGEKETHRNIEELPRDEMEEGETPENNKKIVTE